MHVQARASTGGSGFAEDDDENNTAVSAAYTPGAVSQILGILDDAGFNLRTAGGRRIELGGEFAFAVDPRDGDEDHEKALQAAVDVLNGQGIDTHVVEVQLRYLEDERGALKEFVDSVTGQGLLIEEINVGTPTEDGRIPVQIYTVKAGGTAQSMA